MKQKFWMCYVEGNLAPVHCHDTEQAANTEAERLARQEKKLVYVLETIACARVADIIWEEISDTKIPF